MKEVEMWNVHYRILMLRDNGLPYIVFSSTDKDSAQTKLDELIAQGKQAQMCRAFVSEPQG